MFSLMAQGSHSLTTKGNQPMFFKRLAQQIKSCVVRKIEQRFKQWTKPTMSRWSWEHGLTLRAVKGN